MVLGDVYKELKEIPEVVLQKIGNSVKTNNSKKNNLKIRSVWYAPGDGEETGNFFYLMTLAKNNFSRRSKRLENRICNLEIEIARIDNFNIFLIALPLGSKEKPEIIKNYGFEQVFNYMK